MARFSSTPVLDNATVSAAAESVIERFAALCLADQRVVAAFLGGSYASGSADDQSDVDLYVVVEDGAYEGFVANATVFVRRLGETVFGEVWRSPGGHVLVFFVLVDGTEGELGLARESAFADVHGGAHRTLVDKKGLLDGVVFPRHRADPVEQVEALRGHIEWFWHDLSHFVKGMARGQSWWALGTLNDLRRICVQLARLRHDFGGVPEGYEKVDEALPAELLAPLRETVAPFDRVEMLRAARAIVGIYQGLARPLAREHGLTYPTGHERVILERLARLS
jgi:predicted nucleotidyltransferase